MSRLTEALGFAPSFRTNIPIRARTWRAEFSVFGISNLPPEMREGMTAGGTLAPRISRAEALQVGAVSRARNMIAGTLATLPIHLRNPQREIVQRSEAPTTLFDQIDPDVPNVVTLANTYEDLFFEQESLWRVLERNFSEWPTFCEHIDRRRWDVGSDGLYIDGFRQNDADVIRFYGPNPALLIHAARAIRTCLTLQQTVAAYANWPVPLGAFTPKEGRRVNEDDQAVEDFLDKWEEARRRRVWGWIPGAVEMAKLGFSPQELELAEEGEKAVVEIARHAGVDPEDLGVSTTSRTYQNAEQRRLDLLDFTLAAYRSAMEQRLSMNDVTPRGYRAKVNVDGFLRSDTKTRMETYKIGLEVDAYTPEEIRELEDRPPIKRAGEIPQNTRSIAQNDGVERRLEVVDGA